MPARRKSSASRGGEQGASSSPLALDPVDRSEALYRLARAQYDARDLAGARKSVLAALEIAPGFERAQALLLEIRRSSGGSR